VRASQYQRRRSRPAALSSAGRRPDSDIYINSKFVSRHHAQLVSDERGCVIEDLNSRNGLFLGDEKISLHRLHDGDVISIGMHQLVYKDLRKAQG
jgi:pSer/pThr/pTyr-binding forkhead associated (FHA) protein